MFDVNIFNEGSLKNEVQEGKTIGFSMTTNIPYYRGIPLSMVEDVKVTLDGVEAPSEDIRFSVDGEAFFTLDEMSTVTSYKWEYAQKALVLVLKEGGLPPGTHQVKLLVSVRTAYIPVPLTGICERSVNIA